MRRQETHEKFGEKTFETPKGWEKSSEIDVRDAGT
jgi:hypothetical protein